ncbi:SUMF1/EgtB/PvdO family nonheme iron enzyme [Flavivirga aquimarina]|uniref:SUMF1/EgtB/PvdO family nonheme iron enzyme n=1 Tax=Flavivirga aquimarina TaxID=2027862 RepID=A0ABT8W9U1_9FLAO|nr:SUMF1/EgtB/PvdO family nonheme iron enzyme [Flavivirga aquimarina]MDO5969910.1 SUMF1/EgtB/PvdO family nonheme iron enzyme [Flavivirga aquimarina]
MQEDINLQFRLLLLPIVTFYFFIFSWQAHSSYNNGNYSEHSLKKVEISPPVLSTPANNATYQSNYVSLSWIAATDSNGGALTYDLYLGTTLSPSLFRVDLTENWVNENFTEFVISQIVDGKKYFEFFHSGLEYETTYYWKVVAKDGTGAEKNSEVFSFTTDRENNLPTAPVLRTPVNGAIDVSRNITLEWEPSVDIDNDIVTYNLFLGSNASNPYDVSLLASGLQNPSYNFVTPLDDQKTYFWRVEAIDGYSNQKVSHAGSLFTWQFTIENYKNDAPVMGTIFSPSDGTKNITTKPVLQWPAATDKDGDAVIYGLYLGNSQTNLVEIAIGLRENKYQVDLKNPYTTYYWRVVAYDENGGTTEGPILSFTPWEQPSPSISVEMVEVTGGDFNMGNRDYENILPSFETFGLIPQPELYPQRLVTLNDYKIGKYEITYGQFLIFLQSIQNNWSINIGTNRLVFEQSELNSQGNLVTKSYDLCEVKTGDDAFDFKTDSKLLWDGAQLEVKAGFENYPMNWILPKGAELFADWLGYRLPTEAEWEYAALGGSQSNDYIYSGTNDVNSAGWYLWNGKNPDNPMTGYGAGVPARDGVGTHEVGGKIANELGIYDMSGNVRELCQDFYSGTYYHKGDNFNPLGPASGTYYALRGGAWCGLEYEMFSKARKDTYRVGPRETGVRVVSNHPDNKNALVYGIVRNENGDLLQNVKLKTSKGEAFTDEKGRYIFQFANGSSTVITPEQQGYTFSPSQVHLSELPDKTLHVNFKAYLDRDYTISGVVKDSNGDPIENVLINGLLETVKTNSEGFYSISVPKNQSFTLEPELLGYRFTNVSEKIENIQSDINDLDFTAEYIGYVTISGIVHRTTLSLIKNGVRILGLPGAPVVTSGNGNYYKQVTKGWSGVLTPIDDEAFFIPKELVVSNAVTNLSQNFQIFNSNSKTITGMVKDNRGNPMPGVRILLGASNEIVTGVDGKFATKLNVGWEGKLKAVFNNYDVSPLEYNLKVENENNASPLFVMTPPGDYKVSGEIKDDMGNPIQGVVLNGFLEKIQTDVQGKYSVWVDTGHTTTVTPSLSGSNFVPINRNIINISSDENNVNFAIAESLSIAEEGTDEKQAVLIYPNPLVEEKLYIIFNKNTMVNEVLIFDSRTLIHQIPIASVTNKVEIKRNLPSGFYIVKIKTDNESYIRKLIVR